MIKVLVVEDDRLTRQGLISIMPWQEHGMQVAGEAANGLEALAFMKKQRVDLALCDIEMPHMDGLKLIEQASALYPDTFFVVLTLYTDFARIQQALRLGAIDYIAKTDLDRESFSTILKRIVKRMNREQQRVRQTDAAVQQMPEALLARWAQLEWLNDAQTAAELLAQLKTHAWHPDEWKRLAECVGKAWNERYAFIAGEVQSPDFLSADPLEAFTAWQDGLRRRVQQFVLSMPFSQEVLDSLLDARAYIHQHLSEELHASIVARQVHMSRSYFCQCFGAVFQTSFLDYVRQTRLDKARELLTNTNQSIQLIAKQTGYADEKYFSRVFKSTYGCVPTEYRKLNRNLGNTKEDEP